ncbi:MAG: arylsulfatase [Gemmataceae bacterium]
MRLAAFALLMFAAVCHAAERPNVLLIITDDQGFGDLGCHGNPKIHTPNLDRFAKQSVELTRFHVCPVCSPTRAGLLTGRYNYRTRVVDTFLGRSMMDPQEVTLAEPLRDAGYRTGIFGKWHLGDCYPLRPQDHGFQEILVCRGGGIGQPADPPGNKYFDPILVHNGQAEKMPGYCSDIFTNAVMKFIEQSGDRRFFAYLAFNAPHDPLQVADELVEPYRKMDLSPAAFPKIGFPLTNVAPREQTARVYAMIENIDTNLGKLFKLLDDRKLANNTIVIFMSDNGPAQGRYNTGLRGLKGTVYDGGLRVPCYWRWPAQLRAGGVIDAPTAHIDVAPTLLDFCGVKRPANLDGKPLDSLFLNRAAAWPERTLFFQWHRGEVPELHRAFAARGPRYKLVQAAGAGAEPNRERWKVELFDMVDDPYEQHDVAGQHSDMVKELGQQYKAWFEDVGRTRGYDPPRIFLGADAENPVTLTRQDWRGPRAGWRVDDLGHWEVKIVHAAEYSVAVKFAPRTDAGRVHLKIGQVVQDQEVAAKETETVFRGMKLPAGDAHLEAWVQVGERTAGATYVEVERK